MEETEQEVFDSSLTWDKFKKVPLIFDVSMFHYNNIRVFLCFKQLTTPVGPSPSSRIIFKIGKLIDIMKVERERPGCSIVRSITVMCDNNDQKCWEAVCPVLHPNSSRLD